MLERGVWLRIDEQMLTTNLTVAVFKDNTLKKFRKPTPRLFLPHFQTYTTFISDSGLQNNRGLNSAGPLTRGFFH